MIERDQEVATGAVAFNGRTVDGNDVELAVVIAIDEADASAHGFDNVFFIGRRYMWDYEASFLSYVFKLGNSLSLWLSLD